MRVGRGGDRGGDVLSVNSIYLYSILLIIYICTFFIGQTKPIKNTGSNGPNIKK